MERYATSYITPSQLHSAAEYIKSSAFDTAFIPTKTSDKPHPALYFEGSVSYESSVDYITIEIQKLISSVREGSTGPITISLLCSQRPFTESGGLMLPGDYDTVAQFELEPLYPGELYTGIKKTLERKNKFYRSRVILIVENREGNITDWVNFDKKSEAIPFMSGATGYVVKGDDVTISLPKVCSSYAEGKTGNMRVRLISAEDRFGKDLCLPADSFEIVAEFALDPLSAGMEYTNVQKHLRAENHFRRKQPIITLSEYEHGTYVIKDWHYLPEDKHLQGSVFFSGEVGYDMLSMGTTVTLKIGKIACNINGFSGGLKVSLIASNRPYAFSSINPKLEYKTIGCFIADGLSKNQFYKNVIKTVDKEHVPGIGHHLIMIVECMSTDGKYRVSDWRNLS